MNKEYIILLNKLPSICKYHMNGKCYFPNDWKKLKEFTKCIVPYKYKFGKLLTNNVIYCNKCKFDDIVTKKQVIFLLKEFKI